MKTEPTSDCRVCIHCAPEDRAEHLFWCLATGMKTPNLPKWCKHFVRDDTADHIPEAGKKIETKAKKKPRKRR